MPVVDRTLLAKVPPLNGVVVFNGKTWDLAHLRPFGFTHSEAGVYVQVIFTCHCFTRDATDVELANNELVPAEHWYKDGREVRVLDEDRYQLSLRYLPKLIQELDQRVIKLADERRLNFVTVEVHDEQGRGLGFYSVFFEVTKERKRRLLLRVQSAYLKAGESTRAREWKRVKLVTILKRTMEGKTIKP